MITIHYTPDGVRVAVNQHTLTRFTKATPTEAIEKFIELLKSEDLPKLIAMCDEHDAKVEWNMAHLGEGKNWPVFTTKERLLTRLCREAGIRDS